MTSHLTNRALEICGVSGVFSPHAIASAVGFGKSIALERDRLWRDLSAHVTEVLSPRFGWYLKPDSRRTILQRFVTIAQIDQALGTAPLPAPGDTFGTLLRSLLQQRCITIESDAFRDDLAGLAAQLARAGALLDAVQFARMVPALDAAHLDGLEQDTKRHILELQRRRDLVVVLPHRHFGYDKERRLLSAFLRSTDPQEDPRPMFVSGIGGVGKSALLARLFRYWQRRRDAPLTIVLDFDRRQLNAGAPKEMLKEVLRQAAAGIFDKGLDPDEAKAIADGLTTMRSELTSGGGGVESTFQTDSSYIAIQIQEPLSADWAKPLRDWPIAIIFDSFESLDRRGGSNVDTVLQFEAELRRALPRLRCIVSGREEPLDQSGMERWFGDTSRRLRLTGISINVGAELLAFEDRRLAGPDGALLLPDLTKRRDATRALGGHPLALLMMLQFAHARPDELAGLTDELGIGGAYQAEFAQTFLYERILDRITDPDVRALAHPGLILRQFNDDMIRYVLARPCLGHDPLPDADQAIALRLKLASEYWLVEPDDQVFQLKHRSDLRRQMLPGLFAKPRATDSVEQNARKEMLARKARDVCTAARCYFRDGPPQDDPDAVARWRDIPARIRRVHALYYQAFITPDSPPDFDGDTAREMAHELGADIETLPLAWAARIDAQLGKFVSEAAFGTLSGDILEKAQVAAFKQESRAGRSTKSGKKRRFPEIEMAVPSPFSDKPASAGALERRISHAFDHLEFATVAQLTPSYCEALLRDKKASFRFETNATNELWRTPLWQALLIAGAYNGGEYHNLAAAPSEMNQTALGAMVESISNVTSLGPSGMMALGQKLGFGDDSALSLDSYRFASAQLWRAPGRKPKGVKCRPSILCLAVSGHPEELSRHLPRHAKELAEIVQPFAENQHKTLEDIRRVYDRAEKIEIELRPGAFTSSTPPTLFARIFRGLTPELYGPLATLLNESDPETVLRAISLIRKKARYWPVEFEFDEKRIFRAAVTPALVETIDRLGVMRQFLEHLSELDLRANSMLKMYDCITQWFFQLLAGSE
jgi:hypothetical protein